MTTQSSPEPLLDARPDHTDPGAAAPGYRSDEGAAIQRLDDYERAPDFIRHRRILGPPTWTLLALLLAAGTFILGAHLGKSDAADSATAPTTAGAAGFAARSGGLGGGGTRSGSAGSGATIGSVSLIDGSNIYVQTVQGSVVKVSTGSGVTFNVTRSGTIADLAPGQFVSVQGAAGADGTVAATSVSQVAAGGFGRGGSGPGTAPGSGTASASGSGSVQGGATATRPGTGSGS